VSELRFDRGQYERGTRTRHLHLRVSRATRIFRQAETFLRRHETGRSTADGTARASRGQSRMAESPRLPSQRGAHEPASCSPWIDVAETPSERVHGVHAGRMSRHCLSVCDCVRNCCDWNLGSRAYRVPTGDTIVINAVSEFSRTTEPQIPESPVTTTAA